MADVMEQHELTSKRLTLRKFQLSDADCVQRLADNYNVAKMTLNVPHPYEKGMAEEWIASHSESWNSGIQAAYALMLSDTKEFIGAVGLNPIKGSRAELGYWIGEIYWGNGYCTEAATALIHHSFTTLGIRRITAEHLSCNPASGKVMIKAGMSYVKSREKLDRDGQLASMECYSIKASDKRFSFSGPDK